MWTQEGTKYGDLIGAFSTREVAQVVESTGSHFFEPSTVHWFGTRNLEMIDGLVMVAVDTKAPEGYPRYWARVFRVDGSAERVAEAHTRRTIVRQAHKIAQELKREDGDPLAE